MFTVLVGHTGLGKGASINPAVGVLRDSGCANILSDKLTIQYILEKISNRGQSSATLQQSTGHTVTFGNDATCFISAPELEDLLTMSDAMPSLKELWEAKDGPFEYGTRHKGLVKVAKPCPTMLAACTPSQIALLFPSKAVGGGFVRRCNFVYEGERTKWIPWPNEHNGTDPTKLGLTEDLKHISQIKGQFAFDPIARKMYEEYYNATGCDEFADEATTSYETSRPYHVLKLAMCLTLSRFDELVINFVDLAMAIKMVNQVCDGMKKVFRAVGDSDLVTIMDKVIRYIEARSKTGMFVSRQDLMSALWRDVGTNANLDLILATLETGNIIKTAQKGNITVYVLCVKKPPQKGTSTIQ